MGIGGLHPGNRLANPGISGTLVLPWALGKSGLDRECLRRNILELWIDYFNVLLIFLEKGSEILKRFLYVIIFKCFYF